MTNRIMTSVIALLIISIALSPIINMTTSETMVSEYEQNMMNSSGFSDDDADKDGFSYDEEIDCGTDPNDANSFPEDKDEDSICDGIDPDDDNDGWSDIDEMSCSTDPLMPSSVPQDQDGDGVCDEQDAFPEDDTEWSDLDGDGRGDNKDLDDDNDGVDDVNDAWPTNPCASIDTDGDGYPDFVTSTDCKLEEDLDDDNDGYWDVNDDFPLDPCFALDTDGDGLPDSVLPDKNCDQTLSTDMDDDNDGWPDKGDAFPTDPTEWADFDNDGIGNNADTNDDSDGWSDLFETLCETDPWDITSFPIDTDGDGICDHIDLDDDNDGILDVDDPEPLLTEGSWEWATGAGDMIKINDMAMDSSGNILVTGGYYGNTTLGNFPLLPTGNSQDVFVAKMNNQGNWLWVQSSRAVPKLCANDNGPEYTTTYDEAQNDGFVYTGVYVDEAGAPTGLDFLFVNESLEAADQHFVAGDLVYDNDTVPPTFIGVVATSSNDNIVFMDDITHWITDGVELVKLDLTLTTFTSSVSISVNQGQFDKVVWSHSFGVGNAITIDDQDNAYITGTFHGHLGFGSSSGNEIKSYNMRDDGNWLEKKYVDTNNVDSNVITNYPCGAPPNYDGTSSDMFTAKISSSGSWQWANAAGGPYEDTGDHIIISSDGENGFIAGKLRHDLMYNSLRADGCNPLQHQQTWSNNKIKSHNGMFAGDGSIISELEGCGIYIAKFKLSNGHWKDRMQISPPNVVVTNTERIHPSCVGSCSDTKAEITGIVSMGDPERLYITGSFAKAISIDGQNVWTSNVNVESWFVAKISWNLEDAMWVGSGPSSTTDDFEIHDIVDNGVYDLYVSGCKDGGKFVGLIAGDGTWGWTNTFDTTCEPTQIGLDPLKGPYVTGNYIQNTVDIGGTILEHSAPIVLGHFVAHWDASGNFQWADDNLHLLQNQGSSSAVLFNDDAQPTGILVDNNGRVYTCGHIKGGAFFKSDTLFGDTSYVAAIDGPLQTVEPDTIINPDGGAIPSISMMNTILLIIGVTLLVQKRKNQDTGHIDN